jgi:hypothetical protein
VTYEAYVVSRTSRRPQVDSALTVTFVISSACVDVMHKSCVQECPVDCIYEGARALYINPDEWGLLHEQVTVSVTRPDGPVWS